MLRSIREYLTIFSDQHNHKYKLSNVDGAVYGNILTDKWCNARVTIDDLTYLTSQWLGISVFYIPTESGEVIVDMENTGITNRIAQKFFHKPAISHIHLEGMGSYIFTCIDGKKSVYEIGQLVKEKYGEEAEPLYERLSVYMNNLKNVGYITLKA